MSRGMNQTQSLTSIIGSFKFPVHRGSTNITNKQNQVADLLLKKRTRQLLRNRLTKKPTGLQNRKEIVMSLYFKILNND